MKNNLLRRVIGLVIVVLTVLSLSIPVFSDTDFEIAVDKVFAFVDTDSGTIATVEFDVANKTAVAKDAKAFIAIYTANDNLYSVATADVALSSNQSDSVSAQAIVPIDKTGIYGKVFVWEAENASPLADKSTFYVKLKNSTYNFNIKNNDFITDESLQNMFRYTMYFKGNITTFNGLQIGKGYSKYMGGYISIDKTNVEVYMGTNGTPSQTLAHGLTFSGFLSMELTYEFGTRANLEIKTEGGSFTSSISWDVRNGALFVRSIGKNTLTNCTFSFTCPALKNDTYIYGDSYLGPYNTKWNKYLIDNNYTNIMLNGYSGRVTSEALKSFKTDLKYGMPKRVIWAMGMNDGDKGAINESYKTSTEEVMAICAQYNIERSDCR